MRYGKLRLRTISLAPVEKVPVSVKVKANGKKVNCSSELKDGKLLVSLAADVVIEAGKMLEIVTG